MQWFSNGGEVSGGAWEAGQGAKVYFHWIHVRSALCLRHASGADRFHKNNWKQFCPLEGAWQKIIENHWANVSLTSE